MSHRRLAYFIILVVLLALAILGCSSAPPAPTPRPADAAPTSAPVAPKPVATPAAPTAAPASGAATKSGTTPAPGVSRTGLEFQLGFKMLAVQIPDIVGDPIEYEHYGANGDSLQRTTKGLMAWRKADNWTAFTNGQHTWINGPFGVVDRPNDQRFDWEADKPGTGPTPTPRPTPPPFKAGTVPLGEARIAVTDGKQIEITVLEVIRNADQQLKSINPEAYNRLPPRANDEKVLIKLRTRYVDGPPNMKYASDRVREFGFLQKNGASGTVYPGPLPEPAVDTGILSLGESKEGWIAAIVDRDVVFMMVFGRSLDQKTTFALQKDS